MLQTLHSPGHGAAYRTGGLALFVAIAIILAALGFEHIGGYIPCPLCLQQRWAYYACIPALFVALVMLSAERPRIASAIFVLCALAFALNAALGVYQSGAEWKFWPGPDTCSGAQSLTQAAGNLLNDLQKTHVIRCDEAAWRMFGLSFAGWNVVISVVLLIACLKAALHAADTTRGL